METIAPAALNDLLQSQPNAVFFDVRSANEYAAGHVPQAENRELSNLKLASLSFSKEEPIYLICKSGTRAFQAAELFEKAGFENVVVVEGGTDAWKKGGLSLEAPITQPPIHAAPIVAEPITTTAHPITTRPITTEPISTPPITVKPIVAHPSRLETAYLASGTRVDHWPAPDNASPALLIVSRSEEGDRAVSEFFKKTPSALKNIEVAAVSSGKAAAPDLAEFKRIAGRFSAEVVLDSRSADANLARVESAAAQLSASGAIAEEEIRNVWWTSVKGATSRTEARAGELSEIGFAVRSRAVITATGKDGSAVRAA